MKKLLLLIPLILLSCEKDEIDCRCDVKINNVYNDRQYYIASVPNACYGDYSKIKIEEHEYISGVKNCK